VKRQYLLVIGIVLFVCASASAQDRATAFGNVRFGETPVAVSRAMSAVGLAPYQNAKVDLRFALDQTFHGTVLGEKALVMALFNERGGLEKMIVSFVTGDEECLTFYRDFKDGLTDHYGPAAVDVEKFDFPYQDGEDAIRNGKGHVNAMWDREDAGVKGGRISLSVENNLTVYLTYESATWAAEAERRGRHHGIE
jgi:hypothetical protein